jgi:carbonic anhydrase/acetyltransferase-like protein (isoleucine patch superfamily)
VIGPRVTVGHRAIVHGAIVEELCVIGMGAILLNGCRVGRGSVVGAGAVVPEGTHIPAGSLVLGVPAKVVRPVDDTMRARIEHGWQHYVEQSRRHRGGDWPIMASSDHA